mmetsp:Transcript_16141/g.32150  ORF Transcript_16141/g.32150 Transcript_16141/m.32150 type:complete len:280 (+) Transcript_16141:1103-1942(+)
MAEPAAMSMPFSTILLPLSVQFCFIMLEMTIGASWLSTMAFMRSPPAMQTRPSDAASASASCMPPNSAMGTLNCLRTRAYAPTTLATLLAPPIAPAGRDTPRPSARHSTNMCQPKPARSWPPRMLSMGTHTSVPSTVPFMKAELRGMCLGPISRPGWPRSSSATVKPSFPFPLRRPSGSLRSMPIPTTPATGARVMYLFLKVALTPRTPSLSSTTPEEPMRLVASEPEWGPVRPKHGMRVPSARRGRKYFCCASVPYLTRSSPGPREFGTATVAFASVQ